MFPRLFFVASKLSVQFLRGTYNTCRYVDRCGYQQTKNTLCSKMPPTANLRFFLHKPIAGSLTWTAFPPGLFCSFHLKHFCKKTKGTGPRKLIELVGAENLTINLPVQEKKLPANTK